MGSYGIPGEQMKKLQLHPYYRCPCGATFGDLTDHQQVEKLCPAHMGGDGGYRGGAPQYAKGHEFPEGFIAFLDEHPEIERPPGYEKKVEATPEPPPPPEPEPEKHPRARKPSTRVHITQEKKEEPWPNRSTRPTPSAKGSPRRTSHPKSK